MLVGTTILSLKLGDLGQSSPYRSVDMGWNGANTTRSFENVELPSLGFNLQLVILESIKERHCPVGDGVFLWAGKYQW